MAAGHLFFGGIGYLDEDAYKGMLEQVKNEVHSLFPGQINIAFRLPALAVFFMCISYDNFTLWSMSMKIWHFCFVLFI